MSETAEERFPLIDGSDMEKEDFNWLDEKSGENPDSAKSEVITEGVLERAVIFATGFTIAISITAGVLILL